MIKVYFEEVGWNKVSFVRECKGIVTDRWLKKQVKPYCISKHLDFNYVEGINQGTIIAGFQIIGIFRISKE